jgi:hypothetical protein
VGLVVALATGCTAVSLTLGAAGAAAQTPAPDPAPVPSPPPPEPASPPPAPTTSTSHQAPAKAKPTKKRRVNTRPPQRAPYTVRLHASVSDLRPFAAQRSPRATYTASAAFSSEGNRSDALIVGFLALCAVALLAMALALTPPWLLGRISLGVLENRGNIALGGLACFVGVAVGLLAVLVGN